MKKFFGTLVGCDSDPRTRSETFIPNPTTDLKVLQHIGRVEFLNSTGADVVLRLVPKQNDAALSSLCDSLLWYTKPEIREESLAESGSCIKPFAMVKEGNSVTITTCYPKNFIKSLVNVKAILPDDQEPLQKYITRKQKLFQENKPECSNSEVEPLIKQ